MFDLAHLYLFLTAALLLLLIPGPAVLYIVAQSVERGAKYGITSAAGITFGSFIHLAAAILGLSAILMASATAFASVKYFGATYLICLGIYKIFVGSKEIQKKPAQNVSLKKVFFQGVFVQLLNPKVALFFITFLPQFVHPQKGPVTLQTAVLGLIFIGLGFLSDSAYALLAGKFGHSIETRMNKSHVRQYFSSLIYIGLGLFTAFYGRTGK